MSFRTRLFDLVRANLSGLIDRANAPRYSSTSLRIEDLTDEQLEAELRRRRLRRDAARRAARPGQAQPAPSLEQEAWEEVEAALGDSDQFRAQPNRTTRTTARPATRVGRDARLARLYAQLECPYGADLTSVRKHYRRLMRKYHPDMHAHAPGKQQLASELTQRLTVAYNELRDALS